MTNVKQNEALNKAIKAIAEELNVPYRAPASPWTEELVKKIYGTPITLNTDSEEKCRANDEMFSGGYSTFYQSLLQHGIELGQFPSTGFIGYGALQQISQNGMIRACIQTVADDITREWIHLEGGDKSDNERIEKIEEEIENRYHLRALFNKAIATVGYMGGAYIFIDTGVTDRGLELPLAINHLSSELVSDGAEKPKIKFVLIDPINVSPTNYNSNDPLKENFMKPKMFSVMGKLVHESRLIRLVDNEPPQLLKPAYNFLGIPQAQILWDYVLHWNSARETGVKLLDKLNFMVFKTNLGDTITSGGLSQLDAKVSLANRYRSNDSMVTCDIEEDFQNITLTITGVTDIIRQSLEFIAAINRTPAVKLLGISPSGFNATGQSDLRNYYDHIKSKQELYREAIQKIIDIVQLVNFSEIDKSITFNFNELGEEDQASKAMTAKTRADMISVFQDRNVISAEEARQYVRRDPDMGLDFISEELPEETEGELMTDDPSQQNAGMEDFLKSLAEQPNGSNLNENNTNGRAEQST